MKRGAGSDSIRSFLYRKNKKWLGMKRNCVNRKELLV